MEATTIEDELCEKMQWMGFREQDILKPTVPLSNPTDHFFDGVNLRVTRSPSFIAMMERLRLDSRRERELYDMFSQLVPEVGDHAQVLSLHIVRLKSETGDGERILVTY